MKSELPVKMFSHKAVKSRKRYHFLSFLFGVLVTSILFVIAIEKENHILIGASKNPGIGAVLTLSVVFVGSAILVSWIILVVWGIYLYIIKGWPLKSALKTVFWGYR